MIKTRQLFILSLLFINIGCKIYAQTQPYIKLSSDLTEIFAIKNAKIILSPDKTLDKGTIVVKDGIILSVGTNIKIPEEAVVYEGNGQWIYPGWIDPYTLFAPIPTERAEFNRERDAIQYEKNNEQALYWNEAIRAHLSLAEKAESTPPIFSELRNAGFTLSNLMPSDGIIRGTGSLMSTAERKIGEKLRIAETTMGLSFSKGTSSQNYPSSLMGAIALLRQVFIDASHYAKSQAASLKNPEQPPIPVNLSLEKISGYLNSKKVFIFETSSWQHTLAAQKIIQEADLKCIYKTTGDEYKRADAFAGFHSGIIIPVRFPKALDIRSTQEGRGIPLGQLKEWEQAPLNPSLMAKMKIPFAFTMSGCSTAAEFSEGIRKAIQYGLTEKEALHALTLTPARFLGIEENAGTLDKGKWADMIVSNGNIFMPETKILTVIASGKRHEINKVLPFDMRGEYRLTQAGNNYRILIKGDSLKQEASVFKGKDTIPLKSIFETSFNTVSLVFITKDSIRYDMKGIWSPKEITGTLNDSKGGLSPVSLLYSGGVPLDTLIRKLPNRPIKPKDISPFTFPDKAYGFANLPEVETCLFKNVTLWTNTDKGVLRNQEVLIEKGKISAWGQGLKVPEKTKIIDGTGKHLTTGIIDEHSHIGILHGVNEGTHSVSAEVRIGDVLDTEDINIYRQLGGGVTCAQLLHGSANPIGGQSQIIKLRWGGLPEEMKFAEAPSFIKFALGENVKQSNWGSNYTNRYPQTRMGVEQLMQDAFLSAIDYRNRQEAWQKEGKSKQLAPPARNLQMEALLEILDGKRHITCHSYVQSEVIMLMRLAEKMRFRINTFTHILEGYKIADKLKAHGAFASTFSDWWAYKYEVMDAIPYNAALLSQQGITVCINSDDAEMGRRLNQEAGKSVKYGGMTEEEAWKMVTLNPAKALHIDKFVGSIEKGKDADLVLWSDNPLSIYAKVLYTYIDGKCYFDAEKDKAMQQAIQNEKNRVLSKMIESNEIKTDPATIKKEKTLYHCDSEEGYE